VSRSPEQSEGEAELVLSEAEGKNLVFGKQAFCHAKNEIPFDRLRTGFASAEFILNEMKGSGSE
jgi:hypothetical protein